MFASKKFAGLLLAVSLFAFAAAPAVQASGLSATQISAILSLLQSFGADQSVISNVSTALGGASTGGSASTFCPSLTYNLSAGMTDAQSGSQVSQLQQFLSVSQTGYFGPMTQSAVQNWQSAHGVVSSGSPDTTGYGFVGPQTRSAMIASCGSATPPIQPVPPTQAVPNPILNFYASPTTVSMGSAAVLYWTAAYTGSCNISVKGSGVNLDLSHANDTPQPGGFSIVSTGQLTQTTVFELSCAPLTGATGGYATQDVTVNVGATTQTTNDTLTFGVDATSPNYQIVAGGSMGVTLGVLKLRATGENIQLNKVGLSLGSGYAQDLGNVYLYNSSGQLLGTAQFVGGSAAATSTLTNPLLLAANTDTMITVKGDISGASGDLIKLNPSSAQGNGVSSGISVRTGSNGSMVQGVRIFRSYPIVSLVSLPSTGLSDGRLMRFSVTANSSGPISLTQLGFNISGINSALADLCVYEYTDSNYSVPANTGQVSPGMAACTTVTGTGGRALAGFYENSSHIIPAGTTMYFELRDTGGRGNTDGVLNASAVTAALLGDANYAPLTMLGNLNTTTSGSNFVFSPDGTTNSNAISWTNGYGIPGLPVSGISQTRTGTGQTTPAPVTGVYMLYMNGSANPNITNQSDTQAQALANCQLNAANNPGAPVRCTWNGTEIFNNTSTVTPPTTTLPTPTAILPGADSNSTFNGKGQSFSLTGPLPDSTAFTVAAWVDYTGTSCGSVFSDASPAGGNDLDLAVDATHVYIRADKSGATLMGTGCQPLNMYAVPLSSSIANAWHHIVWVNTGSSQAVYVDGALAGSVNMSGSNVGYHGNQVIGRFSDTSYTGQTGFYPTGTAYFGGSIYAEYYNTALTPAQVSLLWNGGANSPAAW